MLQTLKIQSIRRDCGTQIRAGMTEDAVTLLPQPDSPTSPTVWPGLTEIETPSTARTIPSNVKK